MNLFLKAKLVNFIKDPTDASISTTHEHPKWLEVLK